jgi:hypothetical protein
MSLLTIFVDTVQLKLRTPSDKQYILSSRPNN